MRIETAMNHNQNDGLLKMIRRTDPMIHKPWEVQENLWREKCEWGKSQNKTFLVDHMARRTGKSVLETLRDLDLAEQSGMLRTDKDGSVEIK